MWSKELSIQEKQTIVRLQKQNKSIREIAGTLGAAKSTVWYIGKKRTHWWSQKHKKAWTSTEDTSGGWSKNPLHGKENPFTTSSQEKNTLQEVDVSTIKRRLHQNKYTGFTTSCKQGQVRLWQKTSKKARPLLEKQSLDGRNKDQPVPEWRKEKSMAKAWNSSWSKHTTSSVKHGGAVWCMSCMASSGTGLLVFSDDETEDRGSLINSKVYSDILSAQIQSNAAKLIGRRLIIQMDDNQEHTAKTTQEFLKVKKWNILQWPSQSPDLNPIEQHFTRWRQN